MSKTLDSVSAENLSYWRQEFHKIPELAFAENQTAAKITSFLQKMGIEHIETPRTAVIAEIGNQAGPLVVYRFNIDGLDVPECTGLAYTSQIKGCSHACGHDFEIAWGLGLAKHFSFHPPEGNVRLVFQPAEEGPGDDPKSQTGGKWLAEEGYFSGAKALFSLHVDPDLDVGKVGIEAGIVTASAYDFKYTINGETCHISRPHEGKNPIPASAEIVTKLSDLEKHLKSQCSGEEYVLVQPSRVVSALNPETPFISEINTIPANATVEGSTRVRGKDIAALMISNLEAICTNTNVDCLCELEITQRAIETVNDLKVTAFMDAAAENLEIVRKRTLWRDDAGYAAEQSPTCHAFLGIGKKSGNLHTPHFSPPEDVLLSGFELLLGSGLNALKL